MTDRTYGVLFLCTGNSARSILAEAILNHRGAPRFRAYSAGSHPAGRVNPGALELLDRLRIPTAGLRSKSWDEFERPGAPPLDFVITVCDNAAGESCPVWPGRPLTAHWAVADPAPVEPPEARARAFEEAYRTLARRIELFTNLPIESLDRVAIGNRLRDIGQVAG
ncbi:MAG: arsenate reductase ArsC [Proteobacteria bacterium]|nr:arsenate reductase ArsC [Pseudomonadota bacterium]